MSTPAPSDAVDPKPAVAEVSAIPPDAVPAVAADANATNTTTSASDSPALSPVEPAPVALSGNTQCGNASASPLESLPVGKVPESWLWMTKYDQLFVGVFAAVFLALSGYHWATLGGWGMRPIELERLPARQYDFRIDINSASWVEWTQIEGIGEVTAQKIIDDRKANGPFRSVKDLLRVKGIGPKKLEMMRPFLREPTTEGDVPKSAP